jgi:hypothetical protein
MNILSELSKARKMVENKTLRLEDFEALLIGLFYGKQRVDYYEYIQSPEWKRKADEAKRAVGYRCQICNRHKSEVTLDAHHRTYERLGHELPQDITVLCRDCHELYESRK